MRFNKRAKIIFLANKPRYDPELGKMIKSRNEELIPCASSVISDDLMVRMLGTVEVNAQILAFNRIFTKSISEILFDGKRFVPFKKKILGNRTLLYVREVNQHGVNKD